MSDNQNKKIINFQVKNNDINKENLSLKDFEYDQERPIGKGGYCIVYNAMLKDTKKIYALKVIDKSILKNEEEIKNIINEVKIMNELNSPNLLKLITNFEDENNIYIILPLCQNGQLYDLIHKSKKKIKTIYIKKYLYQTIQAIKALHKKNIIHRDIKPENILIDNKDDAILSDFGIATHCKEGEKRTTYCGTDDYLAPEVIRGQPYDERIDIWAIGILIYECISPLGKTPFNKIDFLQRTEDNKEYIIKNDKNLKINYDKDFDPFAKNLIEKILRINPDDRISIDDILNHIFFKEVNLNIKNEVFNYGKEENNNEIILNELKILKDSITKETYEKMLNSMKEENNKIRNELEEKKSEIYKLIEEKETLLNRNEILNQTINEYKINLDEKNKIVERLTEKRINQLGEGETTLPINPINNINIKINNFNDLLISTNEKIFLQSKEENINNKSKYYEINDIINFELSSDKDKENKENNNKNNKEVDIIEFTNNLKSARKAFGDTMIKIDDNLNDMKHYLKKNDNEFKDRFLSKIKEFNNVIYELKDKIINSIENTMEKINNETIEGKNKNEKLLKEKISENEKIIKTHELECRPKIDELALEVEKWKVKSESMTSQIGIKDKMINNLQETIKRKNEENMKLDKIIKNYQSTYH